MEDELEVKQLDGRFVIVAPLDRQIFIVGKRMTPFGERTEITPVTLPEERFTKMIETLKEALGKKKVEEVK